MPKNLSLKKTSQSVVSNRSQKPITQFFKCDNNRANGGLTQEIAIENHGKSQIKQQKRKAEQPNPCTASRYFVDETNGNFQVKHASSGNLPKKLKSDSQPNCGLVGNHSPSSKANSSEECLKMNKLVKGTHNEEDKRIPLSPVNSDITSNYKADNDLENGLNVELGEKENIVIKILNTTLEKGSLNKNDGIYESSPCKVSYTTDTKFGKHSPCKNNVDNNSKSPVKCSQYKIKSPRISKRKTSQITPEKNERFKVDLSPSKQGSTVKVLTFNQDDIEDIFDDEWDFNANDNVIEDLDLLTMQRCEVKLIVRHPTKLELKLVNDNNNKGTCFIEGVWTNTPLVEGETISILATLNSSGEYSVTNSSGLLVLRPDHLISSTSVVAGVFCKRKAVLQERWRGIDSANTAMTIGILVHELVQAALTRHIVSINDLRAEVESIIKQSTQMLYDSGLSVEETRTNMQHYISPLAEFMQLYVTTEDGLLKKQKDQWHGHIDEVLDIEENVCCPKLGLKGKIDATLQVTIHERSGRHRAIVPLELKSGKASVSAEHRGQLVLYCMMLGLQRGEDPAAALQRGLLLYLKDKIELREVSCGYPERRDLAMLRNELVRHLARAPGTLDTDQLVDIEEASSVMQQTLPEPVHNERACVKCPYLTVCSLHLWHTNDEPVSERHPLTKLREAALGHLDPRHIKYFLHWTTLLRLEEGEQMTSAPLHALWTDNPDKRSKRGTCASNLKLKTVTVSGGRYEHKFEKENSIQYEFKSNRNGPQDGEFSIVSIENRPWIAAGVVTLSNEKEIHMILERDLSRRLNKDTAYHIDTYESYATTVHNLTNLGVLVEDSDRALRLRKLIIDKERPQFAQKLHRSVGRLGAKLMRSLNIEQQRAVLRALAAEDYALLQGLPGTGKTQTISVLIQMLVGLQQRVLVTAHTHSAVDTVLARLPESVNVLRLGSSGRVAAALRPRCEDVLAATCDTPEALASLYDSMNVVGVTCLGAAHALLTRTTFDICIVDEATQVPQCTVLRPLVAARRFLLVGDPDQLPPVVRSRAARRLGMEESLFHRLMSEEAVSTLRLQYRMNRPLAELANRVAYSGRLKCADQAVAHATLSFDVQKISHLSDIEPWLVTACSSDPSHAAVFLGVPAPASAARGLANSDEAAVVLALVDTLRQGGVLASDIGVIAPYRDQVSLLRRALGHAAVEASTVDQFQGRDKSVIIYSCARRDDAKSDREVKEGEVLNDQRRLAVSVTRAKHKLIVIGNRAALRRYDTLQPLIEACRPTNLPEDTILRLYNKYKTFLT